MRRVNIYIVTFILIFPVLVFPETAVEINKRGEAFLKAGKYKNAEVEFNKSISKYNKASARTYHNIGWIYEEEGNIKEARKFYEEAAKRNPEQVHTLERIGLIYFNNKEYQRAIEIGERVLKLEPENQSVAEWLQKAYAIRFQQKQAEIAQIKAKKKKEKVTQAVKKEKEKEQRVLVFRAEIMARSTYELEGSNDYKYKSTEGYGKNFPHMYYLDFRPVKSFQIMAKTGNPYQGALMPDVVHWMEKIDLLFYTGDYFMGMGVLGNHYKSDNVFGTEKKLNDYKLGIIFGSNWKRSRLYISLFPRFIPYDAGYNENKTLDVESFELEYEYRIAEGFRVYGGFSLNGYYFFDHAAKLSTFAGYNDFILGTSLKFGILTLKFEFIEKLYYLDVNNPEPYKFANGQGMFGINRSKWFRGDPISGFETAGHQIVIGIQEDIGKNFFLYQKLLAEFVPPSKRGHDFGIFFGLGLSY